jgi:ring-1,2-phenylacetyl-CoA epoxidase subunit PaaE
MRPKFHALIVQKIVRETKDCVAITFAVPAELQDVYRFQHGQYLTLRASINGEDLRRSYSICAGAQEGILQVAVKQVSGGVFSTWVNQSLEEGMEMQVMTPMGHFTSPIEPEKKKNYLLIAAGSGITPVLSIAKTVLQGEPMSEVSLIYGNRLFHSIIFRETLENLKDQYLGRFRVFHVLSGEPNDVDLLSGRIDRAKLERFAQTFIHVPTLDEVFICGPEPMIRAANDFLQEQGLAKEKIHFELFASPGQAAQAAPQVAETPSEVTGEKCAVTIVYDGQETNFFMPKQGISLLDAAQQNGVDIPFSCKGGMCCTCRAHVTEGAASMTVNYALEPGEVEMGYVLTCQAHPTTDTVVVDFDRH